MRFTLNRKILLLLYGAGIALAVAVFSVLLQVDGIVNGLLYSFGLQYNSEWFMPYQIYLKIVLGLLFGIACIGSFSMVYILFSSETPFRRTPAAVRREPATVRGELAGVHREPTFKKLRKEVVRERAPEKERAQARTIKDDGVEITALPMVCNKCQKVFTQPLCMFDFKSGKPRLVNVCPYCNAVLAVSGNSQG